MAYIFLHNQYNLIDHNKMFALLDKFKFYRVLEI